MLSEQELMATVAVKDIGAARAFYEGKLGLPVEDTMGDEIVRYRCGGGKLLVYVSQFAGTNRATAVTWSVGDVEAEVRALKAKGVAFEHYDIPGATLQGDVHVIGPIRNAWCKDPDGNVLSIVSA
jgi:catechol 2,3-dioxygenase-like lactoylglutathione lyase family enzyme